MAIQFVVEDGTGKSDATSYATVAQFKQYWENRGVNYTSETDANIQAWLNEATEYIDMSYNFSGESTYDGQALEFPRSGMVDRRGVSIDYDTIPTAIIDATCYMGKEAKDGLSTKNATVKSIVYGPLTKTFDTAEDPNKFQTVDKLLKYFLSAKIKLVRVN